MLEAKFVKGKKYVFKKDKLKELYKTDKSFRKMLKDFHIPVTLMDHLDGYEVTIKGPREGSISLYKIIPEWCEEV